jgi:hypothetical protein
MRLIHVGNNVLYDCVHEAAPVDGGIDACHLFDGAFHGCRLVVGDVARPDVSQLPFVDQSGAVRRG